VSTVHTAERILKDDRVAVSITLHKANVTVAGWSHQSVLAALLEFYTCLTNRRGRQKVLVSDLFRICLGSGAVLSTTGRCTSQDDKAPNLPLTVETAAVLVEPARQSHLNDGGLFSAFWWCRNSVLPRSHSPVPS